MQSVYNIVNHLKWTLIVKTAELDLRKNVNLDAKSLNLDKCKISELSEEILIIRFE